MNKKEMMKLVRQQLALDYNCFPEDFLKDGLIFTEAEKTEGRRPFPWGNPRLEMITMGNSVIINASSHIMPFVRKKLKGKSNYEALTAPFVFGVNPYFLPDLEKIVPINENYDINSQRPESLVFLAKQENQVVGIASASADCKTMWQIGVDVLPPYRGNALATFLVNRLTLEVLKRGYIPYYSTDSSNVVSQHVAVKAGYVPAWAHCFKTRLGGFAILKTLPYRLFQTK